MELKTKMMYLMREGINGKGVLIAFIGTICILYSVATVINFSDNPTTFNESPQPASPSPFDQHTFASISSRHYSARSSHFNLFAAGNSTTNNGTNHSNNTNTDSSSSDPYLFDIPAVIFGSLTVFLGALICAGAGVGGGAFNLAAYILFLNMSTHSAVPLSKATILGVAIGGYMVTISKRHPNVDRPLIDYETTLLMEPFALVGSVLGVFFNVAFPEYIILICLVILLSVTAYKTFQKGWATHKKEQAAAAKPPTKPDDPLGDDYQYSQLSINDSADNYVPLNAVLENKATDDDREPKDDNPFSSLPLSLHAEATKHDQLVSFDMNNDADQLEAMLEYEKGIPWFVLLALFLTWAIFVTTIFLAGFRGESVIGIQCGAPLFWVVLFFAGIFLAIVTFIQAFRLERNYIRKVALNYPFAEGDMKWSGWTPYLFPFMCIIAGWTAGFLGVGGGLVQGPILLQMGMQPQVATITSSFMILFTASSTTLQYAILGKISWQLGLWYGCMAFLGAVIGQLALAEFIKRTGRASIAVLLLGVMEVVSMLAIGGLGLKQIIAHEVSMDFQWICQ